MPTRYSPPPRPFLDPPHPSSLPSADKLGLTDANAWAYGISTRLMSDNGRWDLFNLVQGGMVWLDEYMLEIEERLQRGNDEEEEVDFVEFVKTPGRNKSAVKTRSEAAINAEKLARINALHFGELTSPSKTTTATDKQANFSHQLPLSATSQTIRPQEVNPFNPNPRDDFHVISHEPPTPKTHHSTSQPGIPPISNATHAVPAVSTIPTAAASTTSNANNERRFGPRPLPQVPNGMRSRTTSNASLMQGVLPQPPAPMFNRPSSLIDIAPVLIPTPIIAPTPAVASSSKTIPPQERIIAPLPKSSKPSQPAPRTPSPPREEEIGMELDVPLNDTETGRTSIFPTGLNRKPSFSALPDPSPLRKSIRGGVERGKSVERGEAKQVVATSTTPGNAPNSRTSVRPSSSWFKPKSALERTPSTANSSTSAGVKSSLDTDEKTAINTAKNAALGAINTAPAGGVKRKSDLLEKSPVKGKTTDRVAKSAKKAEGAFAGASKDAAKSTPTENSTRSKTPVESSIRTAHTDSEKSVPRSFAMEVEDDTMGVKNLKKADKDDDTAERLLKLRKTLSKVVPLGGESQDPQEEQQQPRSRVDSGAERPISRDSSRPASRNTNDQPFPSTATRNPFDRVSRVTASTDDQDRSSFKTASERPSHATSDRTRVDSGRLSVSHLAATWDKKEKEENRRALEETKAAKKKAEEAEERKKATLKRDEAGSGFGLPKWEPPVLNNKTVGKINLMAQSTTPPGSPTPIKSAQVKKETIFKEEKQSIFKAPLPTSKNIFTAPSTVQKAATTTQKATTSAIFREESQYSQQTSHSGISSQSTADEDPLFEKPIKGLKKQGSNSTLGTMSQPSQEPYAKHSAKDDTAFTWGEEGVTAGWMGGGNDTIGEKQHYQQQQQQQQQRRHEEEEEEEMQDDDEWDGDEEDMTNHRWAAIKAGVEAEAHAEPIEEEDEEMAVDEEEQEEEYEETQEEPEVKALVAASGGIFAQVGSLVMKTASSLKSLNMAAAAAEKERKEKEKKDARKKEMEAQRLAKKAEEEKKRREEFEKKRKLEEERRKKEKADTTLNKSLKLTKPLAPSIEKKQPEIKRQPSKLALGTSTKIMPPSASKRAPTPTQAPTIKLVGASNANASTSSLLPLPNLNPTSSSALPSILGASATKPGAKVTFKPNSIMPVKPIAGPSSGNLMPGARSLEVKATSTTRTLEVRTSEGGIDENEDLPDIKSEYSDSDDEDRPKTYNPPGWAQSPDLRQALEDMRGVNPDTIFGAMPDLKMDEIFPGRRKSKFRTRTSSANWAGTDGVTAEEMEEYARRMGFDT